MTIAGKKGAVTTVAADEGPRAESNPAALAKLAPAFCAGGVVTAGNASSLSDGAAMLVVTSEEKARAVAGSTPRANPGDGGLGSRPARPLSRPDWCDSRGVEQGSAHA